MLKVAFFTEGGGTKGFGHIVRCKALAEEFEKRGFEVSFFVQQSSELPSFVGSHKSFEWQNATEFSIVDIAVIDSYTAPAELLQTISQKAKSTLFFDDFNRVAYPKDGFVLNAAFGASALGYDLLSFNNYLLGSKYVILRKEFGRQRYKKIVKNPKKILLSFGGADNKNAAAKISSALLKKHKNLEITVVSNKKPKTRKRPTYLSSLDAQSFRDLMYASDIGVFSCSQTLYEAFAAGLASIAVLTEQNQLSLCEGVVDSLRFDDRFFAYKFEKKLQKLFRSRTKRQLDAFGARRTVDILSKDAVQKSEITFKELAACDDETRVALRGWRNEPFVREQMTTAHEISEAEHTVWLKSVVGNEAKKVFVAALEGVPFGVCNLTIGGGNAEFGFYIFRKNMLGLGLGYKMCEKFLNLTAQMSDIQTIESTVLKTNSSSFGLHKKLGFSVCGEEEKNYFLRKTNV